MAEEGQTPSQTAGEEAPAAEGEAAAGASQTGGAEAGASGVAEGAAGSQAQASGSQAQVAGTPSAEAAAAQGSATARASAEGAAAPGSGTASRGASREASKSEKKKKRSSSRKKKGKLELTEAKIGFIGAGKMTEAIVEGLTEYGQIQASQIYIATPTGKNMDRFKTKGIKTSKRSLEIFSRFDCDIIFLCFHGKVIKECYKGNPDRPRAFCVNYIPYMRHPIYVLSMVSFCSVDEIKGAMLNPDHPNKYTVEFHRIMINAGCAYGLGVCGVDCDPDSKHLSTPLRTLLSRIARLEHVPKEQIDAACATGGYGLAFAYYFINAMADGAFKVGLGRDMAVRFAAKTAQCGAQTLLESGVHPDQLRDSVISPGGAAIEGIHSLEKTDFAYAVTSAIEVAFQKEKELADAVVPQE